MSELEIIDSEVIKVERSIKELKDRQRQVAELVENVMQDNLHYGKVPGVKKSFLWKAGADKLLSMFMVSVIVKDIKECRTDDEIRYRVILSGISTSGIILGDGVGECSSSEDKYKWRKPKGEEWDNTDESRRRLKYDYEYVTKQVRTNPPDQTNTVLKMAKKRAYVDLALTVTGASDLFMQDADWKGDNNEELDNPAPAKAATKAKPATPYKKTISEAQVGRMVKIGEGHGYTKKQIEDICDKRGYKKPIDVLKTEYESIVESLKQTPQDDGTVLDSSDIPF